MEQQTEELTSKPAKFEIIFGIIFVLGFIFFIKFSMFPSNLQENGNWAELKAKEYLGEDVRENELTCKAIEEKNSIIIVKCKTTNDWLITEYGSDTIYYGYVMDASGNKYSYFANKSKEEVKSELGW